MHRVAGRRPPGRGRPTGGRRAIRAEPVDSAASEQPHHEHPQALAGHHDDDEEHQRDHGDTGGDQSGRPTPRHHEPGRDDQRRPAVTNAASRTSHRVMKHGHQEHDRGAEREVAPARPPPAAGWWAPRAARAERAARSWSLSFRVGVLPRRAGLADVGGDGLVEGGEEVCRVDRPRRARSARSSRAPGPSSRRRPATRPRAFSHSSSSSSMSEAVVSTSVIGSAATITHRRSGRSSAIARTSSPNIRELAKISGASKR